MIPSSISVVRMLAGLGLRRARRNRQLWLAGALLAFPVGAALLALASGNAGERFFDSVLESYLRYLSPFVLAMFASSAVAEEVQGKTITYLFSRPIARWTLPVGKYLGAMLVSASALCASLALVYAVSLLGEKEAFVPHLPSLGRGLAALLLASACYGAVAAAFGTMVTGHPFVVTMIYFLAVEVGFSFIPGWFKTVAMSVHLLSLAGLYRPSTSMFVSDPELPVHVSLPVVLGVTALWLAVAVGWVTTTEYRTDK